MMKISAAMMLFVALLFSASFLHAQSDNHAKGCKPGQPMPPATVADYPDRKGRNGEKYVKINGGAFSAAPTYRVTLNYGALILPEKNAPTPEALAVQNEDIPRKDLESLKNVDTLNCGTIVLSMRDTLTPLTPKDVEEINAAPEKK